MRDVLIHGYAGVDIVEVWNIESRELTPLLRAIQDFLNQDSNEP